MKRDNFPSPLLLLLRYYFSINQTKSARKPYIQQSTGSAPLFRNEPQRLAASCRADSLWLQKNSPGRDHRDRRWTMHTSILFARRRYHGQNLFYRPQLLYWRRNSCSWDLPVRTYLWSAPTIHTHLYCSTRLQLAMLGQTRRDEVGNSLRHLPYQPTQPGIYTKSEAQHPYTPKSAQDFGRTYRTLHRVKLC